MLQYFCGGKLHRSLGGATEFIRITMKYWREERRLAVAAPFFHPTASRHFCKSLTINKLPKTVLRLGTSESTQSQPAYSGSIDNQCVIKTQDGYGVENLSIKNLSIKSGPLASDRKIKPFLTAFTESQ